MSAQKQNICCLFVCLLHLLCYVGLILTIVGPSKEDKTILAVGIGLLSFTVVFVVPYFLYYLCSKSTKTKVIPGHGESGRDSGRSYEEPEQTEVVVQEPEQTEVVVHEPVMVEVDLEAQETRQTQEQPT